MNDYAIWYTHHRDIASGSSLWMTTKHTLRARDADEAHSKLVRRFKRAGFHNMSLVAVPIGYNPNDDRESRGT